MDKKTILTIVVCFVLVFALTFISSMRSSNTQASSSAEKTAELNVVKKEKLSFESLSNAKAEKFNFETDVFNITFDTKGASIASMKLKEHANADGNFVDLIFRGNNDENAFLMYWGDDVSNPVLDNFDYKVDGKEVVFTNFYKAENGKEFKVVKTFEFKESDYLISVNVKIEGDGIDNSTYAYSIGSGPQVGPSFEKISNNNYDYRRFYAGIFNNKGKVKRSTVKLSKSNDFVTEKNLKWLSLNGKYFTIIASPENTDVTHKFQAVQGSTKDVSQTDSIYVSVPATEKDATIYFYCGPQLKKYLGSYYSGIDNPWGLRGLNLDDAMEGGSALGWLESVLKWCLMILNKIIPNYGLDIIVLTLILKIVLWPLQSKSSESTAKMGTITPEVNAIKAKYPNNTQKQNEEMQKLYKEKGINPMGGCLPLLIQFPILIAFYGLLNKHFELRGAMFIPGWIPDLSVPETIATIGFNIPFLGNQIHLLPIIYTASMIFSMKFTQASTQTASSDNKTNMWFMTWGMPIMFFFILYSAPSGLLLYWSTQNALSIIQQVYTNNKIKKFGPNAFAKKKGEEIKKEPAAVLKYQEKLKKLEMAKSETKKK